MQFLRQKPFPHLVFAIFAIAAIMQWISTPIALIAGFLITQIFGNPFDKKLQAKYVKLLLQIAVVGLGFGMNLHNVLEVGKDGLGLTIFSISLTLVAGIIIGKALGLDRKITHLVSSGTSICGGSAIAAVAPVIKANQNQISVALGVVFLLNSIALIIFPPIGGWLNLTQDQFGVWSAIAIHDTSSVVGAAMEYGERALEVATTVKLSRALWIIPVSFLSMWMFKEGDSKVKVPWFIILFIVAILINTFFAIPGFMGDSIDFLSKSILVLTIFLVGAGIDVKMIRDAGSKPISLGISLWLIISLSSLGIILFLS